MMSEHTEGPWEIKDSNPNGDLYIGTDDVTYLAIITQGPFVTNAKANARLIAAAPDLLAACEDIEAGPDNNCAEIHLTDNYQQGLFCGLEDMDITDRYNACMYGFNKAVERVVAWAQGMVEAGIAKATT